MATSRTASHARRTQRRNTPRGSSWMSERQLDAYLQTREALRRINNTALLSAKASQPAAPPSAARPSSL
jgi:hypothetical protein